LSQDGKLNSLIQYARNAGADRAEMVATGEVVIDAALAGKCREPGCPNYGSSRNCPPHVAGPAGLQALLKTFHQALVFRIDVPTADLFSEKRVEIFQRLHKTAAAIEQEAHKTGFPRAKAYAGGSCRELFCQDQPDCSALAANGECRFPQHARPSMSGFGIDVARLFETAGWTLNLADPKADAAEKKMANICGLVLID
jgi:predicted metal-binding protein